MTIVIDLSDEKVTALRAQAAAQGLSLEEWIECLAENKTLSEPVTSSEAALKTILDIQQRVKPDPDGLTVHDYINFQRP